MQKGPACHVLKSPQSAWIVGLTCLLISAFEIRAQTPIVVSGIVLDSARQPVPFVAIQVKGVKGGYSTGEDATFYIPCLAGDTLVFTRLGYHPFLYATIRNEDDLMIELKEMKQVLNNITIYDKLTLPGVNDWKKNLKPNTNIKFQNPHQNPSSNTIPTFGPGITIGFGGKDKTKNKRDEIVRTQVFRETVNDPGVKKRVMDLYAISEETYHRKLEAFNKETPDAAYLTNRNEIISMLIQFFALKEP